MRKYHYEILQDVWEDGYPYVAFCNKYLQDRLTKDIKKIDCKKCLNKLKIR